MKVSRINIFYLVRDFYVNNILNYTICIVARPVWLDQCGIETSAN